MYKGHNTRGSRNKEMTTRNLRDRTHKPDYTEQQSPVVIDMPPRQKTPKQKSKTLLPVSTTPLPPLLPSPVRDKDYRQIEEILKSRVKEQDAAMRTISDNLYAALTTRESFAGPGKPRIYKMLFAGTSGCGKTETAQTIRYLLGMDPGYEYEAQYVDIDASTINNETQLGAQTGASPGLVGYGDTNTLAHRLNRALRLPRSTEDDTRRPQYIMLFIDEIDKAHIGFLVLLNGLLDRGVFEAACGERFVLPQETILFVIFTANYGEAGIASMTMRLAPQGEMFVKQAMVEGQLRDNTIERMGRIVIFYPLGGDVLKKILMGRLEQYIAESEISRQYGANRIEYQDDVKQFLIDKVVAATDSGKGVRSGLRGLFENVHVFFQKALCELNKMVSEEERANLRPEDKIVISKREIELKHFANLEESLERECELFMRHIVRSLLDDPHCRDLIPHYREKKEPIDAMSVHFGGRHIVSSCFGAGLVMIQQNNLYQNCTFAAGSLPEDYTHLKENMDKLNALVKTSSPNDPQFYHKVKRITRSSTSSSTKNKQHTVHTIKPSKPKKAVKPKPKTPVLRVATTDDDAMLGEYSWAEEDMQQRKFYPGEYFTREELVNMFGDEYEVSLPSTDDEYELVREPEVPKTEKTKKRSYSPPSSPIIDNEQRECTRCRKNRPVHKFFNYMRDGVSHYRSYCNRCRGKK